MLMTAEVFGPFGLTRRLGCGGMAEVRLSWGDDGECVAVKRLRPTLALCSEFSEMLLEEARLMSRLDHPNIVKMLDVGLFDDAPYLVFEYVDGLDLSDIFLRLKRLNMTMPAVLACFVVRELCKGLHYAHTRSDDQGRSMGIVHRDVSLPNVVVSFNGEVKLIDFGIASTSSSPVERDTERLMGRLAYMSPEQIRGLPVDGRSDIFSAGVVLFELLTGQRLFHRVDSRETVALVKDAVVPRPRSVNPGIPETLERALLKALALQEDDRFQTAEAMAESLDAALRWQGLTIESEDLSSWLTAFFGDVRLELRSEDYGRSNVTAIGYHGTFLEDLAGICGAETIRCAPIDGGVDLYPIVSAADLEASCA